MEKLNSDMVLEIRSRLPIKSIIQCTKVCKIWRTLFRKQTGMLFTPLSKSSKQFEFGDVELYYREQSSEKVTLNSTEAQDFYKTVTKIGNLGVYTFSGNFRLVGSCNGLVCFEGRDWLTDYVMYISNPITGERIRIPKMGKLYEPAGFGYCPSTKEYKVVKIFRKSNGKRCRSKNKNIGKRRVQVYTLGDGRGWRRKPGITYEFYESGVFANGSLHWLINERSNCDIVAFDLADETFRCLPSIPSCHIPSDSNMKVNLGSVGGNLYLMCFSNIKQGECIMDIWVFKKKNVNNCRRSERIKERTYFNTSTWIRKLSRKWESGSTYICQLLSLTENEILLWQINVLTCYDATTLEKIWWAEGAKGYVQATPHMHSLVSLNDLGEELAPVRNRKCIQNS